MGGKIARFMALLGSVACTCPVRASVESSVASATRLCAIFDSMGTLSEKCKIAGYDFAVEISLDTSGAVATKICADAATNMAKAKLMFDPQWQLKIYSPFSNGKTIAVCNLRK
jgi:hypothetical protein